MDKDKMYDTVMKIIERGHNVEIQRKPDGTLKIYEIKRKTVTAVCFYQNQAVRCYTSAGQVET